MLSYLFSQVVGKQSYHTFLSQNISQIKFARECFAGPPGLIKIICLLTNFLQYICNNILINERNCFDMI